MAYPESVDMFVEKLNKADTVYVIQDEELVLENGVFEGVLAHDNVKNESVMVFTGPKMSGERINNFFLSIPSNAPWKRIIKVFANAPKVYVTYETAGDQVEAEDINRVQESIVNTQKEVERYKAANNQVVSDLGTRLSTVESKKADKTYVDTELLKKADKENTYTKAETDSRIQAIIGAAPEALDTLAEIAEALNNDPDFAATITNMLAQKVDKVAGMGLSEANFTSEEKTKLSGIEEGANKYIHPSTHPASMIVETSEKRFVSDIEKATWNAKETPEGAQEKADIAEQNAKAYADSIKPTKVSELENDENFVTQEELENAGYGDMLKSIYDTDNDGKVDAAEVADSVPWTGVTGKPSTFPPSSHAHGEYTKRILLVGQCQKATYRRSVIALVDVTNTNPNADSNTQGVITFHRRNGLNGNVMAIINMEKRYDTEGVNYSGLTIGFNAANIRPCTFIYNGVKYGGIEFHFSPAELAVIEFNGVTNFNIFGLDYYDTRGTVLNSEVNDSLNFDDVYWINTICFNGNEYYTQGEIDTKLNKKMPKGPLTWNQLRGVV